jgi:hypothetical protein
MQFRGRRSHETSLHTRENPNKHRAYQVSEVEQAVMEELAERYGEKSRNTEAVRRRRKKRKFKGLVYSDESDQDEDAWADIDAEHDLGDVMGQK